MDDYVSLAKFVLDDMTNFSDDSDHTSMSINSMNVFVDHDPGKRVTIEIMTVTTIVFNIFEVMSIIIILIPKGC